MFRFPSPRLVAALFAFSSAALCAVPASAQVTGSVPVATVAGVLRSINPQLTLTNAQAYARSVMADAWRTHLDPRFIMSIVTVESHWRANAVSRVGARGLGQLMPGTAATLHVNPRNPADNLRGTSVYLASLVNHFAGRPDALKLAIAGYNAGPKAVERFHGIPPYAETRHYVTRVLHVWKQLDARVGSALAERPATKAPALAPPARDAQPAIPLDRPLSDVPESDAIVSAAPAPANLP